MALQQTEMDQFRAIDICEGSIDSTEDETIQAWAHMIKTGLCWKLQGYCGRMAMSYIESDIIDHEGNII